MCQTSINANVSTRKKCCRTSVNGSQIRIRLEPEFIPRMKELLDEISEHTHVSGHRKIFLVQHFGNNNVGSHLMNQTVECDEC